MPPNGPVAQLDRASDYESEGRAFESLRVRHHFNDLADIRRLASLISLRFSLRKSRERGLVREDITFRSAARVGRRRMNPTIPG